MHQAVKVDTQSVYLGSARRSDLAKDVGLMSTSMGPRAPVKLGAGDLEKHQDYTTLSALQLEEDNLKATLKTKCGSIGAAEIPLSERCLECAELCNQIGLKIRITTISSSNERRGSLDVDICQDTARLSLEVFHN